MYVLLTGCGCGPILAILVKGKTAMPELDEERYSLSLSGEGINIKKEIDRDTALAVVAALMGGKPNLVSQASTAAASPEQSSPAISLREYLDGVRASKKPEQIAAIGHYICQHEGKSAFSRDDVKTRYSLAREPMPSNFPRDFNNAIKAGLIQEVHGNRGQYYVTNRGAKAIGKGFGR